MKSWPSAASPPTWVVTPVDGHGADGRHDRRPVRAERGQRADGVEAHGRVAQVGRLELLEPGRQLRRQLVARRGEQGRDAGRVELACRSPGRRRFGERPLHPVDPVDGVDGGGQVEDALDVGRVGRASPRRRRGRRSARSRRPGSRGTGRRPPRGSRCPGGRMEASGMPCSRRRNGVPRRSRKARVGMSTATGRAMTQWAICSQRDSRAMSAATPTGRPNARRTRSRSPATPTGVDARAEHAQDGRQEGQGVEHRGGHGQRPADAERAQGRGLEQEQPGQADGHGQAGEGRRPCRWWPR